MPREMLFDLVMPGDILGYVTKEAAEATGFPEGVPVVATSNDKAVEGLGTGCMGETTACISLGTYTAGMMEGKENLKVQPLHGRNSPACQTSICMIQTVSEEECGQ